MINTDPRVALRSLSKLSCKTMFNSLCGYILFVVLLFVERYLSDSRHLVQGYSRRLEGNQNTANWSLKEVRRKESFLGVSSCWKCVGRDMRVRVKWDKPKQPKPPYLSVYTQKFPDVYIGALLTLQVLYLLIVMWDVRAGLRWKVLWQISGRMLW